MDKIELKELQGKYGMRFLRHHITNQILGLYVVTNTAIPEFDVLADRDVLKHPQRSAVEVDRLIYPVGGEIQYKVYGPSSWFCLQGWTDE